MGKRRKKTGSRHGLQVVTLCISTTMVLVLLGLLVFFVLSARNLSAYVRENLTVTVMLSDSVTDSQAVRMRGELAARHYTRGADYISKEQAHKTARAFLAGKGITMTTDATPAYKARRRSAAAEVAGYYIFNAGGDRGYVIVSGDDRTEAVLGYTDSGEFDPATAPEGMMAWLKGYLEFIDRLDSEGVTKETAERKARQMKAQKVRHAIQPLVTSRWNQGDPYNLLCPRYYNTDGTQGDRSATGCVATALAQVMYLY